MTTDDALDLDAVARAYEARVRELFDGHVPEALALRGRLDPQRWRLEWHLPWWVGGAYGLDAETCHELVVSNVLGLAALLLADDARDGQPTDAPTEGLYEAALEPYRARFGADSPFWTELDRLMGEWHAPSRLSARGAPLKVSAFAVCLLADRPDDYSPLAGCLDHALEALVLYDHLADWSADLAAGRPNAFVDHVCGASQVDGAGESDVRSLVQARLLSDEGLPSYLARIATELTAAATSAEELGIAALADHLRSLDERIGREGIALEAHYDEVGRRSTELLFGRRS